MKTSGIKQKLITPPNGEAFYEYEMTVTGTADEVMEAKKKLEEND